MIVYIPFLLLGLFLGAATIFVAGVFYRIQKKEHAESNRQLQEYLHRWQIESDKNDKIFQRLHEDAQSILRDVQKTNHDNAIFLRMIFERVDRPGLE